ncbi:exosortase N [Pedobacter steynii]|uniref:Exosortase N n=1 Tax=Pedobacter steynii TaxID=430522 RepID=A0A1D7QGV9_9SPHI|nr:exosortase N [Pedobacter steynii]AOM77901.1 exosortase N [Pedobacter steynii]
MEIAGLKKPLISLLPLMMFLCYTIMSLKFLSEYLVPDIGLYIGIAIIPYVCRIEAGNLSLRFLLPALLFTLLAFFIPAKSTLFFTLVFTILLLFESFLGKVSLNFFFVLALLSPLFKFFSDTLSFPLRIWLSNTVAETITMAGIAARSAGNIITIEGYDFYIDQACAGLNMLNISLLISLFILSYHQKKNSSTLSFFSLLTLLTVTFLFNIISNFFRIMMIVIFKIMPETIVHDLVGICSLIIYVILPLIMLSGSFVQRFGKIQQKEKRHSQKTKYCLKQPALHVLFFGMVIFLFINSGKKNQSNQASNNLSLKGYQKTNLENNVVKFENKKALIYLKPTPFYAPEHNPMICWTGSGYEFQLIKKEIINGTEIYTGTLVKGKDKIYASWWFDNGKMKTINQFRWRWSAAKGSQIFYLVNVNTSKIEDLKRITATLLPSPFAGNL